MSKREFDTLKVGDLVTPKRGKNKGMHAVVTHIWESGIKVDGYRENRSNLYQAFGEADTSYDTWMDGLGIADFAYVALEQCYRDPEYVRYCNGMTVPWDWIYYEDGIYVWN